MDAYSRQSELSTDARVSRVTGEIEEVKQVMVENIDRHRRQLLGHGVVLRLSTSFEALRSPLARSGYLSAVKKLSSSWIRQKI